MTCSDEETLILVDHLDTQTGTAQKLHVHQHGLLHRAFSIFVFNDQGQLMLQHRALSKYHSGGLWTNTCCGHPRPEESTANAARRRLQEEMGFECPLFEVGTLIYKAKVSNDLIEHEFDHVYVGRFNAQAQPDPNEAHDWAWIDTQTLTTQLIEQPELYTVWFKKILEQPSANLESLKDYAQRLNSLPSKESLNSTLVHLAH